MNTGRNFTIFLLVLGLIASMTACAEDGLDAALIEKHNQAMEAYRSGRLEEAEAGFLEVVSESSAIPEAYLGLGRVRTEMELYDQAAEDFTKALEIDPELAAAYTERGWAYFEMGRYGEAIEDYSRAVELGSETAALYTNRGIAYFGIEEMDAAKQDLQQALLLDASFTPAATALLQVLYDLEDFEGVVDTATALMEQGSGTLSIYLARGDALLVLGDNEAAMEDFEKAVQLDGESVPALKRYAKSLCEAGHTGEGLVYYDDLVKLQPEDTAVLLGRANCHEIDQSWQDALADYLAVAEMEDQNAAAAAGAGRMYVREQMFEEAEQYLNRSLELEPTASTYNALGLVHFQAREYELALEAFQEGRAMDESNASLTANLALAAFMMQDFELAEEAVAAAEALQPGLGEISKVKGLLAYQAGDYETAQSHFLAAAEVQGNDPYIHLYNGTVSYQLAMYDDALRYLEKAVALSGDDLRTAHAVMAFVYQEMGMREDAVIECRLYLKSDMDPTLMFGGGMFNVAGHAQEVCNRLLDY